MKPITFDDWPRFLLNSTLASRTVFSRYLRAGMALCGSDCPRSAELFPIPAPFLWTMPERHQGSRRRRQRWRKRRAIELLVNLQIAALNFSFGAKGPWNFGLDLSPQQKLVVDNLLGRVRSLSRLGRTDFLGSGSRVAHASSELESLHVWSTGVQDLPYGIPQTGSRKRADTGDTLVASLKADMVAFPNELTGFNPLPYLDDVMSRAYHNPSALVGWREGAKVRTMPPDVLTHETRAELLRLGWRWDRVSRLCLALPEEICVEDRCNLFCIPKGDGELRQIIDRRPRNSRELPPPTSGPKMGHPSSFLGIVIPPNMDLLGSLDDLRNFYHEFEVSLDRALSTPVGCKWSVREWEGSSALVELRARFPDQYIKPSQQVYMCFKGLSMGDHWAPCLAQASHENLLKKSGALRNEEHLCFGKITPRAPLGHFSGVCIDDKVNMQLTPKSDPNIRLRDTESCEVADQAYLNAGLEFHPKKRQRRAATFVAWGAEVEGVEGFVGAKRSRLCSLSATTMKASQSRIVTKQLLETLLGSWAFCFQFRRCLFSLIQTLYNEGAPDGSETSPFLLTRAAQQELQLLSLLGPTALTQLRSQVSDNLYATDASPEGAGAVRCRVGRRVAQEIFRRCESRGFHTRLLSKPSCALHEHGLEVDASAISNDLSSREETAAQAATGWEGFGDLPCSCLYVAEDQCDALCSQDKKIDRYVQRMQEESRNLPPETPLSLRFDFIEVYAGCARMTTAFAEQGLVVGPPIELKRGWDLLDSSLFHLLHALCLTGRVAILWLGPPCPSFSCARTPKLRSISKPLGFDMTHLDVARGNLHLHGSLALWFTQFIRGRFAFLDTPWGSFAKGLPWWKFCVSKGGVEVKIDQCVFGSPYQNARRVLTTHQLLSNLSVTCPQNHVHYDRDKGSNMYAGSRYCTPFCTYVAKIVTTVCNGLGWKRQVSKQNSRWKTDSTTIVDSRGAQRFVSHLWSTQLAESLPWVPFRKYRFKHGGHINVLESHARRSLLLNLVPCQRVVVFQDSMVTLGAGAKGRSSSRALNNVMQQEMAIQIAKDLYVGGAHAPTWALRADDPSRNKTVRLPRAPLPSWFLELRVGKLSRAQDSLDEVSDTPRSLGRWFLLCSVALLAVSGESGDSSRGSQTLRCSKKSCRSVAGQGDRCNCSASTATFGGVHCLAHKPSSPDTVFERPGTDECHLAERACGGIWSSSVRERRKPKKLCRDFECPPTILSIPTTHTEWPMAVGNYLGKLASHHGASPHAFAAAASDDKRCFVMELDQASVSALSRLLRFTSACRDVLLKSEGLRPQFRLWASKHHVPSVDACENSHSRGPLSVRENRRALRDSFFQEVFQSDASLREALAFHSQPVESEV